MPIRFEDLSGHTPPLILAPRPASMARADRHRQCPQSCLPCPRPNPDGEVRRMKSAPFAWMFALNLTVAAAANASPGPADGGFSVERLADGVYAAVRTDPPGLMVDANSLFIVNDNDVVVVDAPEASVQMIAALRRITGKPVSYLINTHWHDDHVIGNAAWRKAYPGIRFIAHASLREYLPTTGAKNRAAMIKGAPQFAAQMQ